MTIGEVMQTLTESDISLCLQSLEYTRRAFENYTGYPSYEFKQMRLAEVDATSKKLRAMRRGE